MVWKTRPVTSGNLILSGGTGQAVGSAAGIINLQLTPSITPIVEGTYTYTVIVQFTGYPEKTVAVDVLFVAVANTEP